MTNSSKRLEDNMNEPLTALVTGASRGIGRLIADKLKTEGYHVLTPTRSELDLLSDESIDTYVKKVSKDVDLLVNNAGINPLANTTELSDQDISETMQVNLIGPLRLTCGIIPSMIAKNYGRIVNTSSIWSAVTMPRRTIYSISKSGLNAMTRSLAVELAGYNILVNAVAPGYVNTELTKKNNSTAEIKKIAESIPLKRLAEPEEIAEVVVFLCSKKNTYITGQILVVDGGFTCL
jgi:NAD(P)-dependent dehydrogenase (short-subunit alcohol dehydrogenase family)